MMLPLLLAMAVLQTASPAVAQDSLSNAYLDAAARELVARGRERRTQVEGRIERYSVLARSRASIGLKALRRNRMFYRCEAAARVHWSRSDTIRIELLGAREAVPMFSSRVRAGDGDCGGPALDPTGDGLALALSGGMSADSGYLRHPLGPGSERDYRFRSGGTTTMRLPDGSTIRLLELQVLPRRSEPYLVSGSLWLEDRNHAVVRAVLRLARPFDYQRDYVDSEMDEDDEDEVPGILKPLRADVRYLSMEYGLFEQEYWLPRLVAFEGEAQVGRLMSVPLEVERTFSDYTIEALPPGVPIPEARLLPADSACEGSGDRSVTVSAGTGESGVEFEGRKGCQCRDGLCRVTITQAAVDSIGLISSDLLPPSIFEEGEVFLTSGEMEEILARVESGRRPPWRLAPITWRTGLQGLDLVRYNRVEGLSLGAAANLDLGRAALDATVRVGIADLSPNFELAASRGGAVSRYRVGGYRRLDAVGPGGRPLGLGGSLSSLLLGRDDGDYYRSWGAELVREPVGLGGGLTWRLFGEIQREADKKTDFHLAGKPGETSFRPNFDASPAEQVGLAVRLEGGRGTNPVGWRGQAALGLLGSTGTYSFVQPTLTLTGAAPLPLGLLGSLQLAGGSSFGDTPVQSRFFLGGGSTVRGYGGDSARGEAFWTGRGEIATDAPGARLVAFADAGWAGAPEAVELDPMLLSAGGGVSFLDGLLRIDLARALRGSSAWRLEMQVDAGL